MKTIGRCALVLLAAGLGLALFLYQRDKAEDVPACREWNAH